MTGSVAAVLAHQGGWDEALLVGVPIVVIVGVLAIAKRRVDAHGRATGPATPATHRTDRRAAG